MRPPVSVPTLSRRAGGGVGGTPAPRVVRCPVRACSGRGPRVAMRPPVSVPTLSRRAKVVIGSIAVLLVLFTAIGTLTNVYVDYPRFDETGHHRGVWAALPTRAQ